MHIDPSIRHIIRDAPNVWEQTYTPRSYEVDAGGRLSVIALCNVMQDAASGHARALGVSVQHLLTEGRTWVLSRMALQIGRLPEVHQPIRVRTWPSGGSGLFALRDFLIAGQDRTVVAAGVSAWLVIDVATRRPLRIAPFLAKLRPVDAGHVLDSRLDKLPVSLPPDHEQRLQVRYRDLDINRHVNFGRIGPCSSPRHDRRGCSGAAVAGSADRKYRPAGVRPLWTSGSFRPV